MQLQKWFLLFCLGFVGIQNVSAKAEEGRKTSSSSSEKNPERQKKESDCRAKNTESLYAQCKWYYLDDKAQCQLGEDMTSVFVINNTEPKTMREYPYIKVTCDHGTATLEKSKSRVMVTPR